MNREEFDAKRPAVDTFEASFKRVLRYLHWTLVLSGIGTGIAVGFVWTFAAGVPLAIALALITSEIFRRESGSLFRRALIRRFPELDVPGFKVITRSTPR